MKVILPVKKFHDYLFDTDWVVIRLPVSYEMRNSLCHSMTSTWDICFDNKLACNGELQLLQNIQHPFLQGSRYPRIINN